VGIPFSGTVGHSKRVVLVGIVAIAFSGSSANDLSWGAGVSDPNLVLSPAPLPLQPVGVPFVDPVFGSALLRISEANETGGFETQIYNQLQAFSSDNKYLLLDSSEGFLVRHVSDLRQVQGLDTSSWNDPRWHPTQPHVIIHFDSNDDAVVRVQFTDIDTLTTTTAFTFPTQYQYIRVPQSFDEVSHDGRWLAGMLTRNDGASVIFSLDIENGTLGAEIPISDLYAGPCQPDPEWGEVEPDWIGVSPLGKYLVVQWVRDGSSDCSGLETFDIQTGEFVGHVTDHHHHGDLGVDSDGATEIFMTTEFSPPFDPNGQATVIHQLPGPSTGVSPPVWLQSVPWSDEDHISLQGPHGVGLVSWGKSSEGSYDAPFQNELFLQYTDGSVLRLAHHRSSKCGYWVQPRASISRDGRYVVFASDWGEETGTNSCGGGNDMGAGDPYIIDLGENGTTAPSPNPTALSLTSGCASTGSSVTITVNASQSGAYFKYWVNETSYCSGETASWNVIQDWTTGTSATWIPTTNGRKTVVVHVAGDTSATCPGMSGVSYEVGGMNCIDLVTVSLNPATGRANEEVTITATGAENNLNYRFYVNNNSYCASPGNPDWQMLQDWSSDNTCAWTPTRSGLYTLVVWTADDTANACAGMGGMTYKVE